MPGDYARTSERRDDTCKRARQTPSDTKSQTTVSDLHARVRGVLAVCFREQEELEAEAVALLSWH